MSQPGVVAEVESALESSLLPNQYPKVSHTFIRREILALERQGINAERYALRGWLETPRDSSLRGANRGLLLHLVCVAEARRLCRGCVPLGSIICMRISAPTPRKWRCLRAASVARLTALPCTALRNSRRRWRSEKVRESTFPVAISYQLVRPQPALFASPDCVNRRASSY